MILVVCALRAELKYLAARPDVEILETGVGPVEAALATANALARRSFRVAINAGIGGAFRGAARVGDAMLVVDETLADLGREDGAPLALPDGVALIEREHADARLIERAGGLPRTRGVTVSRVTTTDATARRLRERYDAGVESMEGFAVLRAAALARVPCLEVRGISNYVGERSRSEWSFESGARATARALTTVLDRIGEERSA